MEQSFDKQSKQAAIETAFSYASLIFAETELPAACFLSGKSKKIADAVQSEAEVTDCSGKYIARLEAESHGGKERSTNTVKIFSADGNLKQIRACSTEAGKTECSFSDASGNSLGRLLSYTDGQKIMKIKENAGGQMESISSFLHTGTSVLSMLNPWGATQASFTGKELDPHAQVQREYKLDISASNKKNPYGLWLSAAVTAREADGAQKEYELSASAGSTEVRFAARRTK